LKAAADNGSVTELRALERELHDSISRLESHLYGETCEKIAEGIAHAAEEARRSSKTPEKVYAYDVSLMVTSPSRPGLRHQRNYRVQGRFDSEEDEAARRRAEDENLTIIRTVSIHNAYRLT
jgi:hypothetical protein